jgi:hypothetical protein
LRKKMALKTIEPHRERRRVSSIKYTSFVRA